MSDVSTLTAILIALVPVLVAIIAALTAGIGWLIKHERERREEIENQVSEKKYSAYITLINIFFEGNYSDGLRVDSAGLQHAR